MTLFRRRRCMTLGCRRVASWVLLKEFYGIWTEARLCGLHAARVRLPA